MIIHKQLICTTKNHFQRVFNGQSALIQSKVFEQSINIMGETISDMDIEIEQKDNKMQLLEHKVGIPDSKVIEEMNRLDLNKKSCEQKMIES